MVKREEREIRLFDLFISICQRWRSLLICLVVGAVLLGGYGWYKSGGSVPEPITEEEAEEAWNEVLAPGEMVEVKQLHSVILSYEKLFAEQEYVTDIDRKLENMEKISSGQNAIAGIRNLFSKDQDAYLEYLMGDHNIVPGDEKTYSHKDNMAAAKDSVQGRKINKKYLIVGALGGLILAALIILIKYIAAGTLRSVEDVEDALGLQVIARFDGSNRFYDKRRTGLDRWLRRVKQKNKQKLSYEEEVDVAAARIRIESQKKGFRNFCIAVDSGVALEKAKPAGFLDDIAEKTETPPEVFVQRDILKNPESMQKLSDAEGAVLVVQIENSRLMDVQYEKLMCMGYGAQVIGAIIVE